MHPNELPPAIRDKVLELVRAVKEHQESTGEPYHVAALIFKVTAEATMGDSIVSASFDSDDPSLLVDCGTRMINHAVAAYQQHLISRMN